MQATGFYTLTANVQSYAEISQAFRAGLARVALVIPPEFERQLGRGATASAQLIVDGCDPLTVGSALDTAAGVAAARSADLNLARLAHGGAPPETAGISLSTNTWYNPDLRTAVYIVPGLVGVLLTLTMVMITAMAIVRERERGTLEQLIVSPLGRGEMIMGKIIPFILIGYVQMTLILGFGWLAFDVPFAGSLPLLYGVALAFIAASLAIGLFFSTLAVNQQQAMQMSFFFIMPNILLSGFMFPWEGMPWPAQVLSQALPLTHFLRIVRGIVLRGSHFTDMVNEVIWLAGIFTVLVVVASLRFRKKLG